ncbi:MAG: hypothetical protein JXA66_08530 [Oligoflexia bacterium]|nr:hypothetical protein [Oligoflexia bacterium]
MIKLNEDDFRYLYNILDANITDFDCGAICALENDGVPVCCEVNVVIPILYKNEYKYVNRHCKLWKRFKPENAHDKRLIKDCGYDDIMAICRGHKDCNRNYRSMVCRTFPFYPFIEKNGNFLGLTYNYDFENKCILVGHPGMVNPVYIKQSLKAWNYVFDKDEAEYDAHYDLSRVIENKRRRKGKKIDIINTEGVFKY